MIRHIAIVAFLWCSSASGATLIVNNTDDGESGGCTKKLAFNNGCTLREAVTAASSGDSIQLPSGTLILNGEISITKSINIVGAGALSTFIHGDGTGRLFAVTSPGSVVNASISKVTLNGGKLTTSNAGGALVLNAANLLIEDCSLAGGAAQNGSGGAIINQPGSILNVRRSTFENNSAAFDGGAIASHGTLNMENSTISGNTAQSGGGIHISTGVATIVSTTVANNGAAIGGGLRIATSQAVDLDHVLIADNTGSTSHPDCAGAIHKALATLIETPNDCTRIVNTDPAIVTGDPSLSPLANNGGATRTHALLATSSAVDAGAMTCPTSPISAGSLNADQRGAIRPITKCDLGAFELVKTNLVIGHKFTSAHVARNQSATLEIRVTNGAFGDTGLSPSRDIVVEATMPAGATGISGSVAGGSCTVSHESLRCEIPQLNVGAANAKTIAITMVMAMPLGTTTAVLEAATSAERADSWLVSPLASNTHVEPLIAFEEVALSAQEGGSGAMLVVRLSEASLNEDVSFTLTTAEGTATTADFVALAQTFTISAGGEAALDVQIPLTRLDESEPDETFSVILSAPQNAVLDAAAATAVVTILENEALPMLSMACPATVSEGETLSCTVSLDKVSTSNIGFSLVFTPGSASAADLVAPIKTAISPGDLQAVVELPITVDGLVEGNETFTFAIGNAPLARVSPTAGSASVVIVDLDTKAEEVPPEMVATPAETAATPAETPSETPSASAGAVASASDASTSTTAQTASTDNAVTPPLKGGCQGTGDASLPGLLLALLFFRHQRRR